MGLVPRPDLVLPSCPVPAYHGHQAYHVHHRACRDDPACRVPVRPGPSDDRLSVDWQGALYLGCTDACCRTCCRNRLWIAQHLVAYGPQDVPVLPCPWKRTRLAPGVVPVTLDLYQKNPAAASSETASYDDPATETVIAASCLWNRSVPSSSEAETAAGAAALCWQTDENGETYCPDSHVGCCCCADFESTIRATAVDFSSAEEAARATRNVSSCVNHCAIFSGSAMRTNRSVKPTDSNRKNPIGSTEKDRVHVAVLHVLAGDWRSVSGLEMAIGGALSCFFYCGKLTRIVSSPRPHYRRCCHSDISFSWPSFCHLWSCASWSGYPRVCS